MILSFFIYNIKSFLKADTLQNIWDKKSKTYPKFNNTKSAFQIEFFDIAFLTMSPALKNETDMNVLVF